MSDYLIECYNGRHWLIRNRETGAIAAYPGHHLPHVARAWLAYETAVDGHQVTAADDLAALIDQATARIVRAIEADDML